MTKPEPERLEKVGIRFPRSLTEQLDTMAKDMDCSRSVLIRSILWNFLQDAKTIKFQEGIAQSAEAQFRISVIPGQPRESGAMIIVESNKAEFVSWMCACEYFMTMTAQKSGLGFDEALSKLCEGAHTYVSKILRLDNR